MDLKNRICLCVLKASLWLLYKNCTIFLYLQVSKRRPLLSQTKTSMKPKAQILELEYENLASQACTHYPILNIPYFFVFCNEECMCGGKLIHG